MSDAKLQARLKEFLPQVRVGVDFGEGAGGVAVVRDAKILHAETYVDFHETTLEQRRQLRRGRRTRRARKMRLARLRSWILRQKLPDGTPLPDPYVVMRKAQFHPQPGVYQTHGQPPSAPSWVDLSKLGKADAVGFVKALTLIFQKRGYKWNAIALEEMTDEKLKGFLETARIPNEELYQDVKKQIDRRREDPASPVRGKSKIDPDELSQMLDKARSRQPQLRIAEHRSVKEADLENVVQGFASAAELSQEIAETWKRELSGLLNKVLRPARFKNRLKTGCAWCGKPTPRKAKVRKIAYAAAVFNLRVRDGRLVRRLCDKEMTVFWEWWKWRQAAAAQPAPAIEASAEASGIVDGTQKTDAKDAPKKGGIEGHLKRLGAQYKMARQLEDLLWHPDAKGRASLCRQHLEQAAKGVTMKQAGVEWQTMKVRKAPNPCREQHDRRVLHRLGQILFRRGKTGNEAWRYGPVSFITLEVPAPQTEQAKKGEQKERKTESFFDRLKKETGGVCIYCDGVTPRQAEDKDHIFPQSDGGPDVWDNLVPACKACNTQKGDRTPYVWLNSVGRWERFEVRVEKLARDGVPDPADDGKKSTHRIRISERKRALLLSHEPEYPENPTPLAHVGARPRQFVADLIRLFEKHKVKPPRVDYQLGEPFVQRIDGRTTSQHRKSWLKRADGVTDNFPAKDRWDLLNHAQDAALIAACPPHTWRDTIFRARGSRPRYAGNGKFEWAEQDGLAVPDLAPDWAEFMDRRTWPIVHVLGRYPVGWKRSFADQNFYQKPERLDDKRLLQYVPLTARKFKASKTDKKASAAETRFVDSRAEREFRALGQKLVEERKKWKEEHPKPDKETRRKGQELGLTSQQTIPQERLQQAFPGIRHKRVTKQKGGELARVAPADGPPRKIQLKQASEAAVFWLAKGKPLERLAVSVRWPAIFSKFGVPRYDPSIPRDARTLGIWKRHKLIWLDEETEQKPGYYRVKEFSDSGVIVLPENAVTDAIAKRLGLKESKKAKSKAPDTGTEEAGHPAEDAVPSEEPASKGQEIKLGRKHLVAYFQSIRPEQMK